MKNFEVYRSHDQTVSKYIHDDGSETAVKAIASIQSVLNPLTQEIEIHSSDRHKYSIFISSSVGCFMKCNFCHLTLKNSTYVKLVADQVLANLKEAIADSVEHNPELKTRYIKLSWMGMGDALNKPDMVYYVTLELLNWVFSNGYAAGLDGVDLSTVYPKNTSDAWIPIFQKLDKDLRQFKLNPIYSMDNVEYSNSQYSHKNVFRLFYSIGSPLPEIKNSVIPNACPADIVANKLQQYANNGEYCVILHHLYVDNLNDSPAELDALVAYVQKYFATNELRILRYNHCVNSVYKESSKFIEVIRKLNTSIPFLKVQVSPGKEVSAACGQFIVKQKVSAGTSVINVTRKP